MKAQGLPLNTIIIAAIALVVFFVVILIFRGVAERPGELYTSCGAGIYAELKCLAPGDAGYDNPLCVGKLSCENHDEARCCPRAG